VRYIDLLENSLKKINIFIEPIEVQMLIFYSFSLSKEKFFMKKEDEITDIQSLNKFNSYLKRLNDGEPIQYIIGMTEFFSLPIFVDRGVLIPRQDTEMLVEEALKRVEGKFNILDIGAGSGAISLAIAKNSDVLITSVEISEKAIKVFKKNIENLDLKDRINIVKNDLFPNGQKIFDMILSNPPYISRSDWEKLNKKVREFEPKNALIGGESGTEIIERIVNGAGPYLKKGGFLLIEIGYDQSKSVLKIFKENGFNDIKIIKDYSGIGRVIIGRK